MARRRFPHGRKGRYEKSRAEQKYEQEVESRCGEVKSSASTKTQCREYEICFTSADQTERSSQSISSDETGAHRIYSNKNVSIAKMMVARPTTWPKNVTAQWEEFARAGFPKFLLRTVRKPKMMQEDALFWVTRAVFWASRGAAGSTPDGRSCVLKVLPGEEKSRSRGVSLEKSGF